MGETSSLGPIDAQVPFDGHYLSAAAIIDGLDDIKIEVEKNNGKLNPAYIPVLQKINPGIIKECLIAQEFSQTLVRQWLEEYKFSNWKLHRSSNKPVTESERKNRAAAIAKALCSHSKWLTHGRSLGIEQLAELGLEIINYTSMPELNEAITKYFVLLTMTFDMTLIYKIFETQEAQVVKQLVPSAPIKQDVKNEQDMAQIGYICPKCKRSMLVQASLRPNVPLMQGFMPFPENNKITCPNCGFESDVSMIRMDIEAQTGKKIL